MDRGYLNSQATQPSPCACSGGFTPKDDDKQHVQVVKHHWLAGSTASNKVQVGHACYLLRQIAVFWGRPVST